MPGKRAHEGYLLIDHRDSPGVPLDLLLSIGLPPECGKGVYESPTVTCCHCNAVVILNPMRTRPRGYCAKCDAYVCDNHGCNVECRPFAKLLDDAETQIVRNTLLLGG